jgi:hypothetical protein
VAAGSVGRSFVTVGVVDVGWHGRSALLRKICAICVNFDAEKQRSRETEFFSAFLRETLRILRETPRNCFWLWLRHVMFYGKPLETLKTHNR